jgi:hypothetical protein
MYSKILIVILFFTVLSIDSLANEITLVVSIQPAPDTNFDGTPTVKELNNQTFIELATIKVNDVWTLDVKLDEGQLYKPLVLTVSGVMPKGYAMSSIQLHEPFYNSGQFEILLSPIQASTSASTIRKLYSTGVRTLNDKGLLRFYQQARYTSVERIKSEGPWETIRTRTIQAAFKFLESADELSVRIHLESSDDAIYVKEWLDGAVVNNPQKVINALGRIEQATDIIKKTDEAYGIRLNTLWSKIAELDDCNKSLPLLIGYKDKLMEFPLHKRSKLIKITKVAEIVVDQSIAQCLNILARKRAPENMKSLVKNIDNNINALTGYVGKALPSDSRLNSVNKDIAVLKRLRMSF